MCSRGETVDAVLVRDRRIVSAGSLEKVEAAIGSEVNRIDLEGRTLLPGFNDNHIHTTGLGNMHSMPDLYGLSKREICESLLEYASSTVRNGTHGWIVAHNWDYPHCPNPHRRDLDAYFPSVPVLLFQFSGHAAWCNSEALRRLKIDSSTKNWATGEVVRDKNGELSGVLREPHIHPAVRKRWVAASGLWSRKHARKSLRVAFRKLNEAGITSVQDNTWYPPTLSALRDLYTNGDLTVRFSCWVRGEYRALARRMNHGRYNDYWYRKGPMKFFVDGAFSSRSAWMTEEYADEPGNFGKGKESAEIIDLIEPILRKGRQVASHAIGDRAVREYCDAIEEISHRIPSVGSLRIRVEHGQLIRPDDIDRLAKLDMYVAAQPSAIVDFEKDVKLLGRERALRAYPYRSLIDAGVPLSFGSDCPGEYSYRPLVGIQNAVDREGAEAIGVYDALRCYTIESARAEGTEDQKGTIETGKLADLVVLGANPVTVPIDQIAEIPVHATMVDGTWVYSAVSSDK